MKNKVKKVNRNNSNVLRRFKDYIEKTETHFNIRLLNLYCENAVEYLSNEFKQFCINKELAYYLFLLAIVHNKTV